MRRLSIATTHAFLLVYAVDDPESFETLKTCFEEIRTARPDVSELPILIVGNKSDLLLRDVSEETVRAWIASQGKLRYLLAIN
jgi:GTPase SAR1 family protein